MPKTEIRSEQIAAGQVTSDDLQDTSVVPGSYTNSNITVDADGRITSASNGVPGSGTEVNSIDYAYAYDTTTQNISSADTFQDITFSSNAQLNGWTHTVSTASFTCPNTGKYLVCFRANAQRGSGGQKDISIRALFNATEVAGSFVSIQLPSQSESRVLSNSFILNATTSQVFKLQFAGTSNTVKLAPGPNVGAATTPTGITLTITRLS